MSNIYRGPSIYAAYEVSVHLAEGFQRRRLKCKKLTDDRRRTTNDGRQRTDTMWWQKLKRILKCEYLHVMYSKTCYTISALVNL